MLRGRCNTPMPPTPSSPPSPGVSCDAALRGHCDALVIPADVAGATHQRPLKSTPFGGTHVFMLTCLQTQRIDGPVYALQSNMQHAMCAGTRFNRRAIRAASAMPSRGAGTRRISSTGISVGSANLFRAAPHEQTETRASDNSAPPAPLFGRTQNVLEGTCAPPYRGPLATASQIFYADTCSMMASSHPQAASYVAGTLCHHSLRLPRPRRPRRPNTMAST